jgi:hypothetical protein
MSTVFISYRREIAAGEARALFNDLVERLGKNSVFMDVDSIALGRDFRGVLQEILASCDLMLVLIGRNWVDVKDEEGRTRLGNPGDFVRLEIEAALKRDIVVIPVLVQGAHMPVAEKLPAEIKDLAYRNGFELSHSRWESDVGEMIRRLGLDAPAAGAQIEPDHPPAAPGEAIRRSVPPPQAKSKRWRIWVLVSAFIIVAAGGALLVPRIMSWHTGSSPSLTDVGATGAEYEKRGFSSLLAHNFNDAYADFEEAAKLFPDLHNVKEIRDLLRAQKSQLQTNDAAAWRALFSTIVSKYSWGIPPDVLAQMKAKI